MSDEAAHESNSCAQRIGSVYLHTICSSSSIIGIIIRSPPLSIKFLLVTDDGDAHDVDAVDGDDDDDKKDMLIWMVIVMTMMMMLR